MEIKMQTQEYEKGNDNFIWSLSLLYAGGVIGKVNYMQGRSALVMRHTRMSTKTGTPSKQRITSGFGIPIARHLSHVQYTRSVTDRQRG